MYELSGRPAEPPEPIDWQVLTLMLDNFEHRPWTIKELAGQTGGDLAATTAALRRLNRNALTYYLEGYVIPGRAAIYFRELQRFAAEPAADSLASGQSHTTP